MNAIRNLIARVKALWHQHGTKILGYISAVPAGVGFWLAKLSADPTIPTLIPHRVYMWIFLGSFFLAPLIVRRGHANSANTDPPAS